MAGCELLPDTLTFNCLITACDQWQLGLELVAGPMRGLRGQPDLVTYNAAMRGCQGAKQWLGRFKKMFQGCIDDSAFFSVYICLNFAIHFCSP